MRGRRKGVPSAVHHTLLFEVRCGTVLCFLEVRCNSVWFRNCAQQRIGKYGKLDFGLEVGVVGRLHLFDHGGGGISKE